MIVAVGDIHGHYWKLVALLAKLELDRADQLVFVGDYIDRGPDSREVLELLIELKAERPNTIFLRGNHEQMMLDARDHRRDHERVALWFGNGGDATVESYPPGRGGFLERIPKSHWEFIEATQMEHWDGGYAFVHAGFLPREARWPYQEDPRLWIREEFLDSREDFGALVIFGHTPQPSGQPLVMANKIGIDTGAAYGGPLTAIKIDPVGGDPCFVSIP